MKKILFAALAVLTMFAMVGCPNDSSSSTTETVKITFDKNTTDTVTGMPSTPKVINKGAAIGTLPPNPERVNWDFGGWFKESGTAQTTQVSSTTTFSENTTIYAKWNEKKSETDWRITFNANDGSVTPTFKDVTKGTAAGDLPKPTYADHDFLGWFTAQTGGTEFTATTLVSADIEVYAQWKAVVAVEEILALSDGGHALYAFTIPEDGFWEDYVALSYKVKLLYPETTTYDAVAEKGGPAFVELYRTRLIGPYDEKDVEGLEPFGASDHYAGMTFITADGMTTTRPDDADIDAYAMRFEGSAGKNSYLHGWIAVNRAQDVKVYEDVLGQPDSDGWYTVEFTWSQVASQFNNIADANSPVKSTSDRAVQWPLATDKGTYLFGIGLTGSKGNVVAQKIKNIQLVPSPTSGVDALKADLNYFDKPAFATNVTGSGPLGKFHPQISDVYRDMGDSSQPKPVYVSFADGYDGGGKTMRWTFAGGTLADVPEPTRTGYDFKGWAATEGAATGAAVTTTDVFSASKIYYAAWEEAQGYVPDPDWDTLTNDYDISTWTLTANSNRQNSWLTYGGNGVYQPLSIDDLRNAVYLVLETTRKPTAGGSIGFVAHTSGFPGTRRDIFNAGLSSHSSTQFIEDNGKFIIVINLKEALLPTDLTALKNPATKWGMIAFQYWDGDNGFNLWENFKAYLLFKDDYTVKSPMSTTFDCDCEACHTEFPGGCTCTISCLLGCTDCGVCSIGSQWNCPCPDCAKLYAIGPCDCTEEGCGGTCVEGCFCWIEQGLPVGTVYQTPAGGEGYFYLNLNDYKTRSNPGANGAPVPDGVVAANKITLTFTENGQRASFRLTEPQKAILLGAANVSIEIVGTATPDTNFRYHIGSPALGGSWNASDGKDTDKAFSAILSTTHGWTANKNSNTVGWLVLQQRAAATTTVEITSIKITATGIAPERFTAPLAGTLFTYEETEGWAGTNTTRRFYVDSGKTYMLAGDARNGHAGGAGTLNTEFAGAAAAMADYGASYSRYIYQIPQDIFDNLDRYQNIVLTYDLIKVSTRNGYTDDGAPQVGIKDNNGAAGGGNTMTTNLAFGTGKSVTIDAAAWLDGYNDGKGNTPSTDRHLGIVAQNENYVMLFRVTSITFGDMAAYVEPDYVAVAAPAGGTLFETVGNYVGAETFEYMNKEWWAISHTNYVASWDDLSGTDFDGILAAHTAGSSAGHTRLSLSLDAAQKAFSKVTLTYDMVVFSGTVGTGTSGSATTDKFQLMVRGNFGGNGIGYPYLDEGNNKTLTLSYPEIFTDGAVSLFANSQGAAVLARISKVVFHN